MTSRNIDCRSVVPLELIQIIVFNGFANKYCTTPRIVYKDMMHGFVASTPVHRSIVNVKCVCVNEIDTSSRL